MRKIAASVLALTVLAPISTQAAEYYFRYPPRAVRASVTPVRDTTPDPFSIADIEVAPQAGVTVGPIQVTGFEGEVQVSVSGGGSMLFDGGMVATALPIYENGEFTIILGAPAHSGERVTVVVTVGTGAPVSFTVTAL